jgi:hypothetical protein
MFHVLTGGLDEDGALFHQDDVDHAEQPLFP